MAAYAHPHGRNTGLLMELASRIDVERMDPRVTAGPLDLRCGEYLGSETRGVAAYTRGQPRSRRPAPPRARRAAGATKGARETILTGRVTSRSTASARTAARQESSGWRDRLERRFSLGRQLSNGQAAKRLEGSGVVLEPPNRAGVTERSDSAEHILVAIRGHSRSSEERLDAPG
jgi:hypothetical protein